MQHQKLGWNIWNQSINLKSCNIVYLSQKLEDFLTYGTQTFLKQEQTLDPENSKNRNLSECVMITCL